jgi:hypothetical protein
VTLTASSREVWERTLMGQVGTSRTRRLRGMLPLNMRCMTHVCSDLAPEMQGRLSIAMLTSDMRIQHHSMLGMMLRPLELLLMSHNYAGRGWPKSTACATKCLSKTGKTVSSCLAAHECRSRAR